MHTNNHDQWLVSPKASHRNRFAWHGGVFEAARRPYTSYVEGKISAKSAVVMTTLRGGAARHAFTTDCGLRYEGADRVGTVSYLPAGSGRTLSLEGVAWEWASLTLTAELGRMVEDAGIRAFISSEDPFVFGMLSGFERVFSGGDTGLDSTYCDTMSFALIEHLRRRYGSMRQPIKPGKIALTSYHLRRITDYVEANIDNDIPVASLAKLIGVSEGHFHRSFRKTTGKTVLHFVTARRVNRAMELLITNATVLDVALAVGFQSASHFARVFKSVVGTTPSEYRRDLGG